MRITIHPISANNSTVPFFACHCTSASSFLARSGMRHRRPRYDRTRKIVLSAAGGVPVAPDRGGGVYDPPPGGVAGGTEGGGISLITSPYCFSRLERGQILAANHFPSRPAGALQRSRELRTGAPKGSLLQPQAPGWRSTRDRC